MKLCLSLCLALVFTGLSPSYTHCSADLMEAYQIAHTEAIKWDASARPYFITSVDDPMESEQVKGQDGKRNAWNFDFVIEKSNKHLVITLHDKTVVNKMEAESSVCSSCIMDLTELRISTEEAVRIARDVYGLLPGTDWAQGYHFVLENVDSVLILSVVGRNEAGTMTRIFFNAKTGEVISTGRGI